MFKNLYSKPILRAILYFLIYFLVTITLSILLYLTIGRYIVENNSNNIKYLSFIDTFIYLTCFLIFFFYAKHEYSESFPKYNNNLILNLILIILVTLAYRIFIDPMYRLDLIFQKTNLPEVKNISILNLENLLSFFNMVLLVPILEEYVFRGKILSLLRKKNITFAILFSSFLFSLIHIDFFNFDIRAIINGFLIGIILANVYLRYGLRYSIFFHVVFNLIWFLTNTFKEFYWRIEKKLAYGKLYWALVLIAFIVLLLYNYSLYKQNARNKILAS